MIYLLLVIAIFFADYFIKDYIEEHKKQGTDEKILNGKIIVTKYHNSGVFLNFLENRKETVVTISGVLFGMILMFFVILLPQKRKRLLKFAVACLVGGAANNLYDRIKRGYVVDYFSFSYLKKVIFNISDLFIFFGSFLIMIISSIYQRLNFSTYQPFNYSCTTSLKPLP